MNTNKIIIFFLLLAANYGFSQTQKSQPAKQSGNTPKPSPIVSNPTAGSMITKNDLKKLVKLEDSLTYLSEVGMYDTLSPENRKKAAYTFIPKLIEALRVDNSFYYPFDSLFSVSKVYPQDSTFRILTWQLHYPKGKFRYFGVIQFKSQKLKIIPLKDLRDTLPYRTQKTLTPENWYGCRYYNIVQHVVDKKPVYTLFGFEASSFLSRRKLIDVLTFDDNGNPKFGAPIFHFKYNDSTTHTKMLDTFSRFFIEYKWDASVKMNYDPEMDLIVYDHLAPPNGAQGKGAEFAYVQDGTYEGFKWFKNRWQWVEKVFTFAINQDDNPPIPVPVFAPPTKQPKLPTILNQDPDDK